MDNQLFLQIQEIGSLGGNILIYLAYKKYITSLFLWFQLLLKLNKANWAKKL